MSEFLEKFVMGVFVLAIGIVLYLVVMFVPMFYVSSKCIDNGYPHSYTTWDFKTYCGRIVNQTEYLVPLYEVLEQK